MILELIKKPRCSQAITIVDSGKHHMLVNLGDKVEVSAFAGEKALQQHSDYLKEAKKAPAKKRKPEAAPKNRQFDVEKIEKA
jgi:hypothetical protein